ncbi:GNAT family N-acetyltransferase [Aquincola sp. S2]|uniref:GNAT family N-acetyltransferase n=1 Tax=Pseudaquabacterium terrae TaxID=2732868 RepID=A0ABX2EJA3_9BURK|nr:GNAT family N-acetyltransferase [Aquabacterium terrae]NRF68705.1 GNAT family N-acetyltransferase [Aquabacterium terrae]
MGLNWTWCRFAALDGDSVYDMLALRNRIFVVEQNCAYLDPDGLDRDSWHLLGRDAQGVLRAYLRVVDPGLKFDAPSIGRVVLDASLRGSGAADELLREALVRCDTTWPGRGNRIGAQAHLQRFYGRHGFASVGDEYDEDGIPHVEMWRQP